MSALMRNIGTVAFCTDQGLGYLARDFYRHGIISKPLLLAHGRREDHWDWYPSDTPRLTTHRGQDSIDQFRGYLKKNHIQRMLFFETPFNWDFLGVCWNEGVKCAVMPMHECMPASIQALPDLWLCPSLLDLQWATSNQARCMNSNGARMGVAPAQFLPVPVPDEIVFKSRERAKVFVHNAGNGGLRGRNGTIEVLQALRYIKSDAKIIIRAQDPTVLNYTTIAPVGRVEYVPHAIPFEELYATGDVFLFPEKFNGLSLPLQEAYASGMLVMCTQRLPMTEWLPTEPMILPDDFQKSRCAGHLAEFSEAVVGPRDIAEKIDEWYDRDITTYSQAGGRWATENNWKILGPKYLEVLRSL